LLLDHSTGAGHDRDVEVRDRFALLVAFNNGNAVPGA
jgi:hypothetical protein